MRRLLFGFIAGFLAVPLGHQILLSVLHGIGFTTYAPWQMAPVPPLGVPTLLSQAFWGGVWGIVFALVEPYLPRRAALYWISAAAFGAFVLTGVFVLLVLPLKGLPPGQDPPAVGLIMGLAVNATWGLVTAFILRQFSKRSA